MGRIDFLKTVKSLFEKYKYVLLIIGLGIFLMLLPDQSKPEVLQETPKLQESPISRAQELEEILSQMAGVGKIKVLLTEADGPQTVYQTDEDRNNTSGAESVRVQTVIVKNSDREERGLIRSVTPPVYLGAIIVCQGGDNPAVKLSVVQAVSIVTGISTDRITVLKMK